jgi:hypothetical protein
MRQKYKDCLNLEKNKNYWPNFRSIKNYLYMIIEDKVCHLESEIYIVILYSKFDKYPILIGITLI